jgi:alkaline phosphatase D
VDATSSGPNGETETLGDYRAKYRLYRTDPDLQAMHAAHPFVVVWDDHEVESNYAGSRATDRPEGARADFATRRVNAYLAYFEHQPVVRLAERDRIYRALRLGALAELFLLDGRQYRTPDSMLGAAQRDWLRDGVAASPAAWKLLANQTMMMANDLRFGETVDRDGWDGFAAERRALLEAWRSRGTRDVAVLTGDEHEFYAGTVSPSGRVDEPAVATEFVGGSVTSGADPDPAGRQAAAAATLALRTQNPQWSYAEGTRNGYQVVEARPDELRVTFRAPTSVFVAGAPVEDLARFRVPRGEPRVLEA